MQMKNELEDPRTGDQARRPPSRIHEQNPSLRGWHVESHSRRDEPRRGSTRRSFNAWVQREGESVLLSSIAGQTAGQVAVGCAPGPWTDQ